MDFEFRWNQWNVEHIARHGVSPRDAEYVIRNARRPYPRRAGNGRYLVWGRSGGGRLLQVVFVLDESNSLFVIHARPLTDNEQHRYRRSRSS